MSFPLNFLLWVIYRFSGTPPSPCLSALSLYRLNPSSLQPPVEEDAKPADSPWSVCSGCLACGNCTVLLHYVIVPKRFKQTSQRVVQTHCNTLCMNGHRHSAHTQTHTNSDVFHTFLPYMHGGQTPNSCMPCHSTAVGLLMFVSVTRAQGKPTPHPQESQHCSTERVHRTIRADHSDNLEAQQSKLIHR